MGGAYTATKFAVVGLSESWAVEFAEADIHVSVLCPGFVKTRIHESQRNRPQRYTSENMQKSTTESTELAIKQYVESGMPAELVGRRVVEAIAAKELYIFTHSEGFREAVKKRFAAIDASFAGVSSSQCLSENL
jgi:NAD(P)-dependent dehydrogenase (short-subunit alcohol dehydrogenase family)